MKTLNFALLGASIMLSSSLSAHTISAGTSWDQTASQSANTMIQRGILLQNDKLTRDRVENPERYIPMNIHNGDVIHDTDYNDKVNQQNMTTIGNNSSTNVEAGEGANVNVGTDQGNHGNQGTNGTINPPPIVIGTPPTGVTAPTMGGNGFAGVPALKTGL